MDATPLPPRSDLAQYHGQAKDVLRGARVDTVLAAAGLGPADLMGRSVDARGDPRAGVPLAPVR